MKQGSRAGSDANANRVGSSVYERMRRHCVGLTVCLGLLITGCATRPPAPLADTDFWSGRLALQVEGNPAQSMSALFELKGSDRSGELVLLSPLGNRLALLTWKDGHAELATSQGTQRSDSLDALLENAMGTTVPTAALFEWLKGKQASHPDWEADLSAAPQGRLTARRHSPLPVATLRIALTR